MQDVRGKVAVITGAASGIGLALAEACVEAGMKVVLADVEEPALERAVRELRQQEHEAIGVVTDVSSSESVEKLAEEALNAFGKVHVVCNNAGVSGGNGGPGAVLWEASLNDWTWITNVNYFGVAHGIRTFVPIMLAQDEEGHVVNTASSAGVTPGNGVYGATKHAVVSMSESLYRDFQRLNTRLGVTCLCPGVVNTGIIDAGRNRPPEFRNDGESPRDPETQARIAAWAAGGMQPAEVAEKVVQAIRDNQLYLLTHDDYDDRIRDRMESILGRRNPTNFPTPSREPPRGFVHGGRTW
jgi:NAD(P)-dependent dehydrogenase (short-subunit alcohol dehydrogenase family)